MRIFIVEDELLVADYLQEIILKHNHEVVGSEGDLSLARQSIAGLKPDVVFLDINLANNENGIKLGKTLSEKEIPFIYITANNDLHTLKLATATNPFTYLSKPFHERDILAVLEMLRNRFLQRDADSVIHLKTQRGTARVAAKDILYISADNVYVEIHTPMKVFLERTTLSAIEDKLNRNIFVRIHRSYLVNKTYIQSWTSSSVKINDTELPVSDKYRNSFLDAVS